MSTEAPDRNLALELVRVTEAAALAVRLGRPRREGEGRRRRRRRDAARIDTVRMNGTVVIGEEKDEAPMLYNGEQVGDGGGSTSRSTRSRDAPDRARPAERDRGDRRRRAGDDVRSRRGLLHGQDRRRPRGGRRDRHHRDADRERPRRREAKRLDVSEVTVVVLERDRHET